MSAARPFFWSVIAAAKHHRQRIVAPFSVHLSTVERTMGGRYDVAAFEKCPRDVGSRHRSKPLIRLGQGVFREKQNRLAAWMRVGPEHSRRAFTHAALAGAPSDPGDPPALPWIDGRPSPEDWIAEVVKIDDPAGPVQHRPARGVIEDATWARIDDFGHREVATRTKGPSGCLSGAAAQKHMLGRRDAQSRSRRRLGQQRSMKARVQLDAGTDVDRARLRPSSRCGQCEFCGSSPAICLRLKPCDVK